MQTDLYFRREERARAGSAGSERYSTFETQDSKASSALTVIPRARFAVLLVARRDLIPALVAGRNSIRAVVPALPDVRN